MSGMKSQSREAASRKVVEHVQNSGDQALAMAMASRAIAEEQQAERDRNAKDRQREREAKAGNFNWL